MVLTAFSASFVQAEGDDGQDYVQQWLEPACGDWYSTKGNLIMSVQDDYINGCKVISSSNCTYDYPRTGTFEIAESAGNRNMKLDLLGNDIHQYLVVDDKMVLRRSIYPEYVESVNGIYIGMTKEDFLKQAAQPANTISEDGTERWEYDADKYAVIFKSNVVVGVRLYKGSTRHFDKSKLGADDTPAAYAQTYGMSETPVVPETKGAVSPGYKTSHGEMMVFSPDYVELTINRR
jgi:hypothetical protein